MAGIFDIRAAIAVLPTDHDQTMITSGDHDRSRSTDRGLEAAWPPRLQLDAAGAKVRPPLNSSCSRADFSAGGVLVQSAQIRGPTGLGVRDDRVEGVLRDGLNRSQSGGAAQGRC